MTFVPSYRRDIESSDHHHERDYRSQSRQPSSIYNYASDAYSVNDVDFRARSVSRELSAGRSLRSPSVRNRMRSVDRYVDFSGQLDSANKDYHDMHASFLSKRWENKHVLSGIQETVIDQTVQLNRVLRLLNEEQYALCQRCHIGGGRGSGGRLRHHRRTISYDPFQVSLDSSNMLLRRQKQFEIEMDMRQKRIENGDSRKYQSINELNEKLKSLENERMKFRIPRDFSQLNSTSDFGDRYRALRGQSEFTRTAANNYTSDIDDAGDAGSYSSKQNPPSSSLSNGSGRNASRKSYIDQINEENEDDASAASGGRSAADRKKDGGLPTTDEKKRRQQQRAGEDAERKKRDDDERRERERREREENERVKQLESELINDAKTAAVDTTPLKDARVIFLVGGPGSGKGTQCEKISKDYGYVHLSSGDLLRAEVQSGSERGAKLNELMKLGRLVPDKVVLDLLKEAMLANAGKAKGFLVDGYPRKVEQGKQFENEISACEIVLYVDASDETMKKRLLQRAESSGRVDDNEQTIGKRLATFHQETVPVIDYYDKQGKLRRVDAEKKPDAVYDDVKLILDKNNEAFELKKKREAEEKAERERKEKEKKEREEKERKEKEAKEKAEKARLEKEKKEREEKERKEREEREKEEKARQEREKKEKEEKARREKEKREKEEKLRKEKEERERIKKLEHDLVADTKSIDTSALKDARIIFVVGGPGSGKGTQCEKVAHDYGYTHLSSGDLLRAEVQSGSERGAKLNELMKLGRLVPNKVVLDLIKEEMVAKAETSKGFLVDGYPRQVEQVNEFECEIGECELVLNMEASDETMTKRLVKRAATSGRVDDNEATIVKRLDVFHQESQPVIDMFDEKHKLRTVDTERAADEVYQDVKQIFDELELYSSKKIDTTPLADAKVIFVIGGPGSGKGTQCEKISAQFGYTHLSSGDLLRAEVQSGSERGAKLNALMKQGKLVPNKAVLDLLKEAMLAKVDKTKGFLVDGYPRQVQQGVAFDDDIVPCELVLYVDASDATMKKRLAKRAATSGRVDDNEATIAQRLVTFHQETVPVVEHYDKQHKLQRVDGEKQPDQLFKDIKALLDKNNELAATKKVRKANVEKIDATVDQIVHHVIKKASNREEVKEDVSCSIHHAIKEVIDSELAPDEESGFSFMSYENLEIYMGPTKLINLDDVPVEDDGGEKKNKTGNGNDFNKSIKERQQTAQTIVDETKKHGEIIIRVLKGEKVEVRADEDHDTIISNINKAEVIIRNVDTNLFMSTNKEATRFVELSIVGQAYIRDLSGVLKAKQFRGIVLVRTDL